MPLLMCSSSNQTTLFLLLDKCVLKLDELCYRQTDSPDDLVVQIRTHLLILSLFQKLTSSKPAEKDRVGIEDHNLLALALILL